jgi:HrpA-like RNA helicase
MLIESVSLGSTEEALSIAACSQVQSIFLFARSSTQKRDRDAAIGAIVHDSGDHLTCVNVLRSNDWRSMDYCRENFLNHKALMKVAEIKNQLKRFMLKMTAGSLPGVGEDGDDELVLKALVKGFVFNVARMMPDGNYRTVRASEASTKSRFNDDT